MWFEFYPQYFEATISPDHTNMECYAILCIGYKGVIGNHTDDKRLGR